MTSTDIVTIIAAVGLVLTNVITAWRTSAKVEQASEKAVAASVKTDEKLDEIHVQTNNTLTSAKEESRAIRAELKAANEQIAQLMRIVGLTEARLYKDKKTITETGLTKRPRKGGGG